MAVYEATKAYAARRPKARTASAFDSGVRVYWLFTLPAFVTIFALVVAPLAYAVYISLRDFNLLQISDRFVGFSNYARILTDPGFLTAFGRTLLYVAVVVSVDFLLGFSQALLLYHLNVRWSKILRGAFLFPILLIPSAAAMLWRSVMYSPPFQEFNRLVGLPDSVSILGQPGTAFWGIVLTVIWAWSPWVFLILLGGLEGLSTDPLEAAQLDGANYWQTLWHIIVPMMRPVIFVALSFKAVDSFLTFPFPWVMTEGGPAGSSHVLSTYIYESSFKFLNYGYGSSMAMIMLVIGAMISSFVVLYAWRRGLV